MSQANTQANDHTVNHRVVRVSVRLRPSRSAIPPTTTAPMNMPTKDSEVTYATWFTSEPHCSRTTGAVMAKVLMSANSKK